MSFTSIVDRRKNGKNKSVVNRNRFIKRARKAIKKQVDEIVKDRNIKDIGKGDKITIPKKDVSEPSFRSGKGGNRDHVLPGNKDKNVGDKVQKPQGGSGGGGGPKASDKGEGEDDFSFNISRDEFLDFFFEDLELPDMVKTQLKDAEQYKLKRAGHQPVGNPSNLNIIRSMRQAMGRKIALQSPFEKEIKRIKAEIEEQGETDELLAALAEATRKRDAVPFIDEIDLRYNAFEQVPQPTSKAVMFCLMDVSGSMGEYEKDLAKRFFMLLYLFLERNYEKVDVVFVRHTTIAKEVDEEEFFYSKESGGTKVSTALVKAAEIIKERYPTSDWNIYMSQASDGDNWNDDTSTCVEILEKDIMPYTQYFAYVQVAHAPGSNWGNGEELWNEYTDYSLSRENFAIRRIDSPNEIYPVFRDLFRKER